MVPDAAGFLYIDREKFHEVFAQDVSTAEALVMAATQKPINSVVFEQTVDNAAWKTIPSWYLVSQEDQAILPELQRFMAKRMGAKTTEIAASHVAFISHPSEVVKTIGITTNGISATKPKTR
jgi:pimeloyl-ACP methyl ester carboxylesterase